MALSPTGGLKMSNFYRLPEDGFHVVNFSGGRSSGYMLWRVLRAHGGSLPKNAVAVFCNTGKEREETLKFVQECGIAWDVDIQWLEFGYLKGAVRGEKYFATEVDFETCSRNGEPFESLIRCSGMVPNPTLRFCTSELKVRTVERWVRKRFGVSGEGLANVIGFRRDEYKRVKRARLSGKACRSRFPMYDDGVMERDVLSFWKANNFDLGLASGAGNCDLCFMKGRKLLVSTIRDNPGVADWWERMEKETVARVGGRLTNAAMAQFTNRQTYADLRLIATSTDSLLEDDGLQPVMDCGCGD